MQGTAPVQHMRRYVVPLRGSGLRAARPNPLTLSKNPHCVQGTAPAERERRFVALLRGGGLRAGAAGAGFGGGWEMQRALSLAQAAGFPRGEAQVHCQQVQGVPAEHRTDLYCTKSDVAPTLPTIGRCLLADT